MAGSSEVDDLAVELAWSLWRALGVPGPLQRHADCVVIPEPLIAFTGALGDRDRRLRDNAVAWCAAHLPLVSVRALRHTLTEERWGVGAIADMAATLHGLTGARWPDWETGKSFVVAAEAAAVDVMAQPSQLALRARALVGVGSRAEILRVLLTADVPWMTLGQLASESYATKRQATDTVEQLALSGVLTVERRRQPYRVRLSRADELGRLIGPVPEAAPRWGPLLRLIAALIAALEATADLPDDLAAAELHRTLRTHQDQLIRLDLEPPPPQPAATYRRRAQQWCTQLISSVASGDVAIGRR